MASGDPPARSRATQRLDEDVDVVDQIILGDEVLKTLGKQRSVSACLARDEQLHDHLDISGPAELYDRRRRFRTIWVGSDHCI